MIRTQTLVIGFCAVIVIIIMLINAFIPTKKTNTSLFDKSTVLVVLAIIVFMLPMTVVKLYAVNCMLEGNCNVLVNVLVGLAVLMTSCYVFLFIFKIVKQRKGVNAAVEDVPRHASE